MKNIFAKGTEHFVQPKQWESMRKAKALEAKLGTKIVHFEKGDYAGNDFTLPGHIIEATVAAVREGDVRYDPGPGIPPLREAIAKEMAKRGRETSVDEVIVSAGAKHGLFMTLLTLLNPGDEVIFPNPGYPPDEVWIRYCGAVPVYAPLKPPTFQFDLDALESVITPKTKLLIINSPQRPNGQLVKDLDRLAEICLKHDLLVISDEIFSNIVYDGEKHETIAAIPEMKDRTIVIDTFSKTYTMTGFRMGWVVAPVHIAEKLSVFLQDSITNVSVPIQLGGLAALTGPQEVFEGMRSRLKVKRDRMVAGLNEMGLKTLLPPGSFYAFPDITSTGMTSSQFTEYLMNEFGVAVVSGTAFGSQGEGYVRMTFAVPDEEIDEGLARMAKAVARLK